MVVVVVVVVVAVVVIVIGHQCSYIEDAIMVQHMFHSAVSGSIDTARERLRLVCCTYISCLLSACRMEATTSRMMIVAVEVHLWAGELSHLPTDRLAKRVVESK